jgi:integrase
VPNFTDASIAALPFVPDTTTLWDDSLSGFGLRIGKKSKTFIVLIASGRRQKLGQYPTLTLGKARQEAKRILAEKTLGNVRPTFKAYEEAKDEYLVHCKAKNKLSTYRGYKWRLENQLNFERKNVAGLTARDILKKLNAITAPAERRYCFVVARSFFNWCVTEQYLDRSPMERLAVPPKGKSRERVLTQDELKKVWHACPDDAYGTVVKLLILTGQRRGEIEHIAPSGDEATILNKYTKNGLTHVFPIGPLAQDLLAKPRKWGGWGKSKARLDKACGVTDWSLHDLRRTFSTLHAELGTPPHIVERLINHITGTVSGVAAVYNRYQYMPEMREATQRYEAHLTQLFAA